MSESEYITVAKYIHITHPTLPALEDIKKALTVLSASFSTQFLVLFFVGLFFLLN